MGQVVTAQAENERLVNFIHLTIVETDVRDHKWRMLESSQDQASQITES